MPSLSKIGDLSIITPAWFCLVFSVDTLLNIYIFCFILLFTSSSPCRKDQFAVLYFSTSLILLIQVYNWEIRHHSLVCCCGFADILNIISKVHRTKFQESVNGSLRWLDTVFQHQYLPSLSINYVAINKVLEKLPPQLY